MKNKKIYVAIAIIIIMILIIISIMLVKKSVPNNYIENENLINDNQLNDLYKTLSINDSYDTMHYSDAKISDDTSDRYIIINSLIELLKEKNVDITKYTPANTYKISLSDIVNKTYEMYDLSSKSVNYGLIFKDGLIYLKNIIGSFNRNNSSIELYYNDEKKEEYVFKKEIKALKENTSITIYDEYFKVKKLDNDIFIYKNVNDEIENLYSYSCNIDTCDKVFLDLNDLDSIYNFLKTNNIDTIGNFKHVFIKKNNNFSWYETNEI